MRDIRKSNPSLSRSIRDSWRTGSNFEDGVPTAAMTFQIGIVMDDHDEQSEGRVWVYVPGFSSTLSGTEAGTPLWKGTAPDRQSGEFQFDQNLRYGWILVSPMSAYFGSDAYRADFSRDGRNSLAGDVNSYGMWSQPRIGDQVGVIFANGDPASGYYIGGIVKRAQGRMVPGAAGYPGSDILTETSPRVRTKNDANLPGYDNDYGNIAVRPKARPSSVGSLSTSDTSVNASDVNLTGSDTSLEMVEPTGDEDVSIVLRDDKTDRLPTYDYGRNLIVGGHGYDIHRGAGTSTMRRESPSYVFGIKTPGWNYDTEQFNKNMGCGQFQDDKERYKKKNSLGHQFVMDDHPDHQVVRIRSSSGSQILLNDSCSSPYVYISTARGSVWLEFGDDGKIALYAQDSISIHSESDLNITADKSFNLECQNLNILAKNDFRLTVGAETHWTMTGPTHWLNQDSMDWHIVGAMSQSIEGTHSLQILGDELIGIGGKYSEKIGGFMVSDVGSNRHEQSGGLHTIDAAQIFLNSNFHSDTTPPIPTVLPKFPELTKKYDAPTKQQVEQNQRSEKDKFLSPIVPQHQPWPGRCGQGNGSTAGTTGRISREPTPGAQPGADASGCGLFGAGQTCNQTAPQDNFRSGASTQDATKPDDFVGCWDAQDQPVNYTEEEFTSLVSTSNCDPNSTGIWTAATNYTSDDPAEPPNYHLERYLKPGEIAPPSSYSVSPDMLGEMKEREGFQPYVNAGPDGNLYVGHGHRIRVDETVAGVKFDPKNYRDYVRGADDTELTYLTPEEADALFRSDVNATEDWVRTNLTPAITQQQYDGFVSYLHSMGITSNPTGTARTTVDAANAGRMDLAQAHMGMHVYSDGNINCGVVARRRDERDWMNTLPNNYVPSRTPEGQLKCEPTGTPIQCGQFKIDPAVRTAINTAADRYGISRSLMYAIASQESGFQYCLVNSIGAKGLFQFLPQTAAFYGIAGQELDPNANADAAARYLRDARTTFVSTVGRDPTNGDLYMQLFLGQNGGAQYVKQMGATPDAPAAPFVDSMIRGASSANRTIFFDYRGNPRTMRQVYEFMSGIINSRVPRFTECAL